MRALRRRKLAWFYAAPLAGFYSAVDKLRRLRAIVCAKVPRLAVADGLIWRGSPEGNEVEYFNQFTAAFKAVGALHRTEAPDRKHYFHYWLDHCQAWLKGSGESTDLSFAPFVCACLAHGDVAYSGLFVDGEVLELGLYAYGIGRPAGDAWRRVLETGEILLPSPPATRLAPASPSRVHIGDVW